jgi:GcrA cell cycle regulator
VFQWDGESVERAKAMFADGKTSRQIANAIGGGLSRSAVSGKLHRLGLVSPMTRSQAISVGRKSQPTGARPSLRCHDIALQKFKAPRDEPKPATDESGARYTLETVPFTGACKWPHGDPQRADFHVCGNPCGGVYCDHHAARARDKTKKAAA